jgi:hypothetical protein
MQIYSFGGFRWYFWGVKRVEIDMYWVVAAQDIDKNRKETMKDKMARCIQRIKELEGEDVDWMCSATLLIHGS